MVDIAGYISLSWLSWFLGLGALLQDLLLLRVSTEKSGIILICFSLYVSCVFSLLVFFLVVCAYCFNYNINLSFSILRWSCLLGSVCFLYLVGYVFLSLVEVFFCDFVWSVPLTWVDGSYYIVFW